MGYMMIIAGQECSLNFDDEKGISYSGNVKDVALLFARHIYNNYNGYKTYIINKRIQVSRWNNNFMLSWVGIDHGDYLEAPIWWNEFANEFNKIMKMKAFW